MSASYGQYAVVFLVAIIIPAALNGNSFAKASDSTLGEIRSSVGHGTGNHTISSGDPLANNLTDTDSSSFVAGNITINEVELAPPGSETGKQWIELYNPSSIDVNATNFKIVAEIRRTEIPVPDNATVRAHGTYLMGIGYNTLSSSEILTLINATGTETDRTPLLVDKWNDDRTWQRIPDGYNQWRLATGTLGRLNEPNTTSTESPTYHSYSNSSAQRCLGSAGCAEGLVTRIVDADTLYVEVSGTTYRIHLALTQVTSESEQYSVEARSFTRNLCLGSNVLVDQDDKLLASSDSIIAAVYCSGINLNSELLENGYAKLDKDQCDSSEFSSQPWAKDQGC